VQQSVQASRNGDCDAHLLRTRVSIVFEMFRHQRYSIRANGAGVIPIIVPEHLKFFRTDPAKVGFMPMFKLQAQKIVLEKPSIIRPTSIWARRQLRPSGDHLQVKAAQPCGATVLRFKQRVAEVALEWQRIFRAWRTLRERAPSRPATRCSDPRSRNRVPRCFACRASCGKEVR